MKINISSLKKKIGGHQPFYFQCMVEQLLPEDETSWISGLVEISGAVINNGRLLEVQGIIKTQAFIDCSRCLETFQAKFELPFYELFQEEVKPLTYEDDNEQTYFQGDEIDLSDLIHETLVVAEPLKMVCSEGCKGLCPSCGVNLNFGSCTCENNKFDPRLDALKKLLKRE